MPQNRKARSEKILGSLGIKLNPYLPVIEDISEIELKSPEEIVKRGLTAFLTAQTAFDIDKGNTTESRNFFLPLLKKFSLENELTEDEKFIMFSENISPRLVTDIVWRMERCYTLFWACGLIDGDLDYPENTHNLEEIVSIIQNSQCLDDIVKRTQMRSAEEILDKADLIYRMDWACVDKRINGNGNNKSLIKSLFSKKSTSGGNDGSSHNRLHLNSDVTVEFHKGLNWVIGAYGAENWDNISADT